MDIKTQNSAGIENICDNAEVDLEDVDMLQAIEQSSNHNHYNYDDDNDEKMLDTEVESSLTSGGSSEAILPSPALLPRTGIDKYRYLLGPSVFIMAFAYSFCSTVFTNQILYQACTVALNYSKEECKPLLGVETGNNGSFVIENIVQTYASKITMTKSLIENILPAFLCLVIGTWSDKFGRKPLILTSAIGFFLYYLITSILSGISESVNLNPWMFLLASIPIVLTGGTCVLLTGIYTYISDLDVEKGRAKRMMIIDAIIGSSYGLGNVAAGYIYAATSLLFIFTTSTVLMIPAILYIHFFLWESLSKDKRQDGSKIAEFFNVELIKDLIHTCIKHRQNFERAFIWLIIGCLVLSNFAIAGENNLLYLFLRTKFQWTVEDFTKFNAIGMAVQFAGCACGMVLMLRVFKISIVTMCLISLSCCLMESLTRALAIYWWQMYLGMILGLIRGIVLPMLRSNLSTFASNNEVGKLFAITSSMEYISPLGAAPLYTMVYNLTLSTDPGIFYFISVGLYLICITFVLTIILLKRRLIS